MINNIQRIGSFTSSEIVALTSVDRSGKNCGEAFYTYIEETKYERNLGRCITDEVQARPLSWGSLVEGRVQQLLGPEYIFTAGQTEVHKAFPFWAGSKDGVKLDEGRTVYDIKSPLTLTSFCRLVGPLYNGLSGLDAMNAIRDGYKYKGVTYKKHKDGNKFYWQLVSNAILSDSKQAELIVYMPFKPELEEIRLMAMNAEGEDMARYSWIQFAREDELPFLLENGFYNNLNIIRFTVPREDINFLTERVVEAGKLLLA